MLQTTTWLKVRMKYVEPSNIFDRLKSQFYNCLPFWGQTGVDRQTARHTIRSRTNRLLASVRYKTGTFQMVVVSIKGLPLPWDLKVSIPLLRAFK